MQKIAIIGVKENQGYELLNLLSENKISPKDIIAVEALAPLGTVVSYGEDDELDVKPLDTFDFKTADIAIFCSPKEQTSKYINKAISANCKIIDLSLATFSNSNIPCIIPQINSNKITPDTSVISVASSTAYQILAPLTLLIKQNKLKRLVVTAFISTSHLGRPAMDELFSQSRKIFLNETLIDNQNIFKKQIAFNILPQIGEFIGDETSFEWQLNAEIKKILNQDIKVHANASYVPTFIGDAVFVNAEFENEVDAKDLRQNASSIKNVVVFDKQLDGGYVSVEDIQGEDNVYVSRIRQDISVPNGISYWSVLDNLRAGSTKIAFDILLSHFITRS